MRRRGGDGDRRHPAQADPGGCRGERRSFPGARRGDQTGRHSRPRASGVRDERVQAQVRAPARPRDRDGTWRDLREFRRGARGGRGGEGGEGGGEGGDVSDARARARV